MVRTACLIFLTLFEVCAALAQDADTYLKVEKARAEIPACMKLLSVSQATGSIPLHFLTYAELDKRANELTHCGFVFRIVGDNTRGDDAGNESDRYDAAIAEQMQNYLKARGLWENFVKQDCRIGSSSCGKK
jgi:hypothetical protein